MSSQRDSRVQAQLQTQERINWTILFFIQVEAILKAFGDKSLEIEDVIQLILGLENMIPSPWKLQDTAWANDYKNAKTVELRDIRVHDCGVPMSVEWHIKYGHEIKEEVEVVNYFDLFQACTDLLYRRGMIQKIRLIEKSTGKTVKRRNIATPLFTDPNITYEFSMAYPKDFIETFQYRYPLLWEKNTQPNLTPFEETETLIENLEELETLEDNEEEGYLETE